MNTEIKQKWIDALRSGKYEQGKGSLNKNNTFCCLGVLCDIYDPEIWDASLISGYKTYLKTTYSLPVEVMNWAGLKDSLPEVNGESLAVLNDTLGYDFGMIADVIEKHL